MLYYFCKSGDVLSVRQSIKNIHIDINIWRHMECADHILITVKIYACFTADTWINHSKKRRWKLYKSYASEVSSCEKAWHISDYPASQCKYNIISVKMMLDNIWIHIFNCMRVFLFFTGCKRKTVYFITQWRQSVPDRIHMIFFNIRVRNYADAPVWYVKGVYYFGNIIKTVMKWYIIYRTIIHIYPNFIKHNIYLALLVI